MRTLVVTDYEKVSDLLREEYLDIRKEYTGPITLRMAKTTFEKLTKQYEIIMMLDINFDSSKRRLGVFASMVIYLQALPYSTIIFITEDDNGTNQSRR